MIKTIELRNTPELKVILNKEEFEIVDISDPKNSGIYSFGKLKVVEFNAERTNWWFSILTIILDLFIFGGPRVYKRKANLNLKMKKLNLKILLIDADLEKAKKITYLLNNHKTYTEHRI